MVFWKRENCDLPELNQEDIMLNRSTTSNKIEVLIRSFPTKTAQTQNVFTFEFYQTFEEELTPLLHKLLHKTESEGMVPSSFCEASVSLISKLNEDTHTQR